MSASSKRSLREKGKFYKELEKYAQQQIDNYYDDNLYPMVGSYYKNESTNRTYFCIQAENGIGTRFIDIHTGYADSVSISQITRIN